MESLNHLNPESLMVELAYRRALLEKDAPPRFRARRTRRVAPRAYGRHPGGGA